MEKDNKLSSAFTDVGNGNMKDLSITNSVDLSAAREKRRRGLRRTIRCGYDVIRNCFFVEEEEKQHRQWNSVPSMLFGDFQSYCEYLDGKIYDKACYYQLDSEKIPESIDKKLLFKKNSFISESIDDYTLPSTKKEQKEYDEVEQKKPLIKEWINKFNECVSYEQLRDTIDEYYRSPLEHKISIRFFLWGLVFSCKNGEEALDSIMGCVSSGMNLGWFFEKALCAIYDPDKVVNGFRCFGEKNSTYYRHRRNLKKVAEAIKTDRITFRRFGGFDSDTHYFFITTCGYEKENDRFCFSYSEYFDSFEQFIAKAGHDLSECYLFKAQGIDYDYSDFESDKAFITPFSPEKTYRYRLNKGFDDDEFYVEQSWFDNNGNKVKEYLHTYKYFCDFVAFLKGDLTKAKLMSCKGLANINDFSNINLKGADITDEVCIKAGLPPKKYALNTDLIKQFSLAENNEKTTALSRFTEDEGVEYDFNNTYRIHYISDLHLLHKLQNEKCQTVTSVQDTLGKIAAGFDVPTDLILINGDTSSDYGVFKLFIERLQPGIEYVFTLGNHELWGFPNLPISKIVSKYKNLLKKNGMYLLHNNILYRDINDNLRSIETGELTKLSEEKLRNKLRTAQLILFGGVGFAGYNPYFNANIGLYRSTLDRKTEIQETTIFEKLYTKVSRALKGMRVIIATHMPLPNWYKPASSQRDDYGYTDQDFEKYRKQYSDDNIGSFDVYQPGFVYISGHTHENFFYDDGELRIYADNQFGYNRTKIHAWPKLKYIDLDKGHDYFADYEDGIYKISVNEYKLFYRLKNIQMDLNQDLSVLYMLKKDGYYCFISQTKTGVLMIMNGGAVKGLHYKDIDYYYEHMSEVVSRITDPLEKFYDYENEVSKAVKTIGGSGRIHGCIVDIDFLNHIYVDPLSGSLTGYWASDIINKIVYPSIPELLEAQCPRLFTAYQKMIKSDHKELPVIVENKNLEPGKGPVVYLDTDIYNASRQLMKMQKLHSRILTIWPDETEQGMILTGHILEEITE